MDVICYLCSKNCVIRAVDSTHILGAECKRGEKFAVKELVSPTRTLTTTVRTVFKEMPVISVKTDGELPKSELFKAMDVIKKVVVDDYKKIGDVLIENLLGTGVNVVVTTNMWRRKK